MESIKKELNEFVLRDFSVSSREDRELFADIAIKCSDLIDSFEKWSDARKMSEFLLSLLKVAKDGIPEFMLSGAIRKAICKECELWEEEANGGGK